MLDKISLNIFFLKSFTQRTPKSVTFKSLGTSWHKNVCNTQEGSKAIKK